MLSSLPKIKKRFRHDLSSWRKDPKSLEKFQFAHHFIPHPQKKARATLLSHKALASYCFSLVFVFGLVRFIPKMFPGVLGYASDIKTSDLLKYTNKIREQTGLNDLRLNPELTKAAQDKAKDMFAKDYWAHVAPDGTQPWDFILKENYDYLYAGENLAKNFSSSKDVVDAWYNSPSHRENLLNSHYDEIGFAVTNGVLNGYETTLVVQFFGKPRDANHIATIGDEENILSSEKPVNVEVKKQTKVLPNKAVFAATSTLPSVDMSFASKFIGMTFSLYLVFLLLLDVWYSKIKAIPKFTGHTAAHLAFLLLAVFGMWFALVPGKIL